MIEIGLCVTLPVTPGQLSARAAICWSGMSPGCVPGLSESSRVLAASTHAYRGPARCLTLHSAALNPNTNCAAAGEEDAEEMAAAEKHIMQALGWKGQGLIAAAGSADGLHGDPEGGSGDGSGGGGSRGA